jgi:16S rRNA (cytosine967-C5)-methyltransferase
VSRPAATAREVAFEVIHAVSKDDAYANLLLPTRLRRARLQGQSAAFATELSYGTLRRRGYYDRVIAQASGRELSAIDAVALDIVRLGTHQLLGMSTASHAAVSETVALTRWAGAPRVTGFVNAVLRRVSEREESVWTALLLQGVNDPDERLAIAHAHPVWAVRALRASLDRENRGDELKALLIADNVPPRVTLVALPGLSEPSELGEVSVFAPTAALSAPGDPAAHPLVASGRARVQDEGSQLAALALSRYRPVVAGERWLDVCAGPGGKAALLAAEARRAGAHLVANELSPVRAGLVRTALQVVDATVEVRTGDGRSIGVTAPGRYDRILVDAPCTGLGALRRRPEARWRKSDDDVAPLAQLQASLLRSALAALAPGGVLAYVTCSPHVTETTAVVDAVLAEHPDTVRPLDARATLGTITRTTLDLGDLEHGAAQLWPHRHGTDAMFVQLLTRV